MAEVDRLSYSSLEDIRQCSEKYRQKKILKSPQIPGWSLVGGNAVHEVTEAIDKMDFGIPVEKDELDFRAVLDKLTSKAIGEFGFPESEFHCAGRVSKANPNKEDKKWWLENGPQMVERWKNFKRISTWDIWVTPQGEPAIEVELGTEFGGVFVKGYLDRIMEDRNTKALGILDLKTGVREPKGAGQLKQYGEMAAFLFGEEYRPTWGAFWMGRSGATTVPVPLGRAAPYFHEDYRKAKAIIEQDLFLTNVTDLCGSCSVRKSCPVMGTSSSTIV